MEIISYLDLFLGALLNVLFNIIIVRKVFKVKIIKNKYKAWVYIIGLTLCVTLINLFNKTIFKGVLIIPLSVICIYKVFDIKFVTSILYTLIFSFYLLIGEVIATFLLSILNINQEILINNFLGRTIGNIFVILATTPLLYIKFISKIFNKLCSKKIESKIIIIFFYVFLIIGSAFVFNGLINIENTISIIMNFIIFIVFIILLYISYFETQKVNKISEEYNSLFKYLDKYEKDLNENRKLIHDFKNQLIVINSYADDNTKLKEYLNDIIEEQRNIKETKILKNINKLPKGLKGLVYYKLSLIEDEIKINLNVNSKFKGFDKLNTKDNKNILKIVGILIDNAIESSVKTDEKYVLINIFMNDGIFEMTIINSCKDNIEKSKIMELGFSTKGKNRGYGLSLVKDIIRNDDRYNLELDNENGEFITNFKMNTK